MANPVYFPILRAKAGEIDAIGRLAPNTRSLTRPMLDFPLQKKNDARPLADYFGEKIQEIKKSWGTSNEIYLDFSRYEPDKKLPDEGHIAEYVFDISGQSRLKAIPVVAPLSIRGPGTAYFEVVSGIVARDKRGMAFRVPFEYLANRSTLELILGETLALTSLSPPDVDVYLDAHSLSLIPTESREELVLSEILRTAATALRELRYRTVIFAASNMPESMTHHDKGTVLRIPRTEFRIWRRLARDPAFAFLRFGDYGIIDPGQVEADAPIIPPSRIRTTTEDEYILYKGDRDGIRAISRAAAADGMPPESSNSWGANCVRECAAGYGDPGGPAQWVAHDTNMHIESTVSAIVRYAATDTAASSQTGTASGYPWLQESFTLIR
jgi:hypothetical protein